MRNTSLAFQTEQFTDALWRLFRIKQNLIAVLPEDLASIKGRLGDIQFESGSKRGSDYSSFYRVGVHLSQQGEPVTMSDLCGASSIPPSTATRIVDWLVENGHAERFSDPEDRRIVRVKLTKEGQELYRAIDDFISQRVELILHQFTEKEREELIRLLGKLVEAIDRIA
ncbi:MAG: MarR family transcriptional regulator [Anaerolineales bacterium]|nr:MarR family transcriptional regulator [Anaerolineales bacterium]